MRKTIVMLALGMLILRSAEASEELFSMSLEQLLNVNVVSVSKTPQSSFRAPAGVYVLTNEDIRRSGATSVPEALRLVPGVDVAQINSSQWAIGIRGFQSQLARATLVLIDGRSVYTPLFAGTYWDVQNVMLEDVDRIEVILGPGGAVWGSNAVNGVINIITKSARETQGTLVTGGGGTEEKDFGSLRYGGHVGEDFHYRFYGKYFDRDSSFSRTGDDFDAWHMGQGGFRTDWDVADHQTVTVQGDTYSGKEGQRDIDATYAPPFSQTLEEDSELAGTNVLGRWTRTPDDRSSMSVQMYYGHTDRKDPDLKELLDTLDADFQHTFTLGNRNKITYGTGYRVTSDSTDGIPDIRALDPTDRKLALWNMFGQDQIALVMDRLDLTLGSKEERNDYTGWEDQPSARLAWTPTSNQTLWGAVSRAVRTPSRVDRDPSITLGVGAPTPAFPVLTVARYIPNDDFESEKLLAYELGYRVQPTRSFYSTVNGFYNVYDDVQSINIETPLFETNPPPLKFLLPFVFQNNMQGRVYGGEFNSVWNVRRWWRVEGVYSYSHFNFERKNGATDGVSEASLEGSSPVHQASFRSSMDLPGKMELDPMVRYVGRIRAQSVPAYWSMDLHLGWHVRKDTELALVGQNLLQPRHVEYGDTNEIERSVYAKVTWRR